MWRGNKGLGAFVEDLQTALRSFQRVIAALNKFAAAMVADARLGRLHKQLVEDSVVAKYSLIKDRKVYHNDYFAVRFSYSKSASNSFSNTVLSLSALEKYDKIPAIETRGLWRLFNDYMGGPFVNYCFRDSQGQRLVMIDCFVYSPKQSKRDQLMQLESVAYGIKYENKTKK